MMQNAQWSRRFKMEMKQVLRMQLFITPVVVATAYYLAAPITDEEQKKLQKNYQRKAGWHS